jgi:Flp pilus assembly protein TadD
MTEQRIIRAMKAWKFALLLICVLALALTPRWLTGYWNTQQADAAHGTGDFARAADLYLAAYERLPNRPDLLEQAALASLQIPDLARASQLFGSASVLSAPARLQWGDALWQDNQQSEALAVWHTLESESVAQVAPRLATAYAQMMGEEARALFYFEQWAREAPQNAQVHYGLGLILSIERPAEAVNPLLEAARLNPQLDAPAQALRLAINTALLEENRAYQQVVIGRALGAQGEWNMAQRAFERASLLEPDYAEAWAWLAESHYQLGMDDYYVLAEKAARLAPQNATIVGMYALASQRTGNYELARSLFEYALRFEPNNPIWVIGFAQSIAASGNLGFAYEQFVRATEIAPQDALYWRLLAIFCVEYGYEPLDVGLPAALRAYALAPYDALNLDAIGRAMHYAGNAASAETFFLRARQANPNEPAPMLNLALLYLEQRNLAQARALFDELLRVAPDSAEAALARRIMEQYLP